MARQTKTPQPPDPQAVAVSVRNNLLKRNYSSAVEWLKKLPQDVCLTTLAIACEGLEPQLVTRLLEFLGFDSNTEFDVFAVLGCDKPFKETMFSL
jgi:hypothetical protein